MKQVHVQLGITNNSSVAPHLYTRWHDRADFSNWGIREIASIHEVFSVSAGTNTFSFVGLALGEYGAATFVVSMTIMFFPTAYATVNTVAAKPDDAMDFSSVTSQPRLYTSEAASANAGDRNVEERVRSETEQVAALRTEFDAQLQALREEIAELKKE